MKKKTNMNTEGLDSVVEIHYEGLSDEAKKKVDKMMEGAHEILLTEDEMQKLLNGEVKAKDLLEEKIEEYEEKEQRKEEMDMEKEIQETLADLLEGLPNIEIEVNTDEPKEESVRERVDNFFDGIVHGKLEEGTPEYALITRLKNASSFDERSLNPTHMAIRTMLKEASREMLQETLGLLHILMSMGLLNYKVHFEITDMDGELLVTEEAEWLKEIMKNLMEE